MRVTLVPAERKLFCLTGLETKSTLWRRLLSLYRIYLPAAVLQCLFSAPYELQTVPGGDKQKDHRFLPEGSKEIGIVAGTPISYPQSE
jgi:hypothetical protein